MVEDSDRLGLTITFKTRPPPHDGIVEIFHGQRMEVEACMQRMYDQILKLVPETDTLPWNITGDRSKGCADDGPSESNIRVYHLHHHVLWSSSRRWLAPGLEAGRVRKLYEDTPRNYDIDEGSSLLLYHMRG